MHMVLEQILPNRNVFMLMLRTVQLLKVTRCNVRIIVHVIQKIKLRKKIYFKSREDEQKTALSFQFVLFILVSKPYVLFPCS